MTHNIPYCVECATRMRIEENGVAIPYSETHIQYGDMWMCPDCFTRIVIGLGLPLIPDRR